MAYSKCFSFMQL
ncbi:unnamed protein product [Linum tenue]|uniref:Uncharacterized protein n=1 Tax=Linum tenue TaxID=586396 RepID=A0AAV0R4A6_9ROSI|nr:unnamed protein product [Linum tenue]